MKTMKRRLGVKDKKILKIHTSKVAFFIPFYMKTIKRGVRGQGQENFENSYL